MRWILVLLALLFRHLRPIVSLVLPVLTFLSASVMSALIRRSIQVLGPPTLNMTEKTPADQLRDTLKSYTNILLDSLAEFARACRSWETTFGLLKQCQSKDYLHALLAAILPTLALVRLGWIGLPSFILWIVVLGLIGLVAFFGINAEYRSKSPSQRRYCRSMSVASIVIALIAWSTIPDSDTSTSEGTSNVSRGQRGPGLTFDALNLSAHTVSGYWKELDLFYHDELWWNGTASVISKDKNKLYLVSNSHVLGLSELSRSDDDRDMVPEVNRYELFVDFASGKRAKVLRFADQAGQLDLAILELSATGLVEGRDYVMVPQDAALVVRVGDEAVAVGSPHGLSGTHTFGRISAIREIREGEPYRVFQTDAAINPGNSGGPLFIKSGDRYRWAGVNTFIVGSDKLGFAIDVKHVWESQYYWYPATPRGAADAIIAHYGRHAVVQ